MQHQIDSATESLQQRMDEYLTRVRRLITGANVGGAIATLGFAGASLKFWETGAVPRPLFWTVVIFLFGLLLVMAATVIEGCQLSLRREAMRVAADHHDSWTDDVRRRYLALFDDARRWIGVELGVLVVAAIAAVAGAVLGLRQLWALTG